MCYFLHFIVFVNIYFYLCVKSESYIYASITTGSSDFTLYATMPVPNSLDLKHHAHHTKASQASDYKISVLNGHQHSPPTARVTKVSKQNRRHLGTCEFQINKEKILVCLCPRYCMRHSWLKLLLLFGCCC